MQAKSLFRVVATVLYFATIIITPGAQAQTDASATGPSSSARSDFETETTIRFDSLRATAAPSIAMARAPILNGRSAAFGPASPPNPESSTMASTIEGNSGEETACSQGPDCREEFSISIYTGMAIDTFAADEVRKYINPGSSSDIQYRGILGFDFAYRLTGNSANGGTANPAQLNLLQQRSKVRQWLAGTNLWLYGETLHGVRSADIDCKAHPDFPTCQTALALPTTLPDQTVFMLRNATTLEGLFGLRWEFAKLNSGTVVPASLYLKTQAGFVAVSGNPHLADVHHAGLGMILTNGLCENSYVEVGYGRTDLFLTNKRKRFKIDGYSEVKLSKAWSFFAQMVVDTDLGQGADAVQSYMGFNLNLKEWKHLIPGVVQ